jgi:hypothetical protein
VQFAVASGVADLLFGAGVEAVSVAFDGDPAAFAYDDEVEGA